MAAGGVIPIAIPSLQRGPQAAVGSCFMDRGGMFRAALAPPTAFTTPPPLSAPVLLQWWQAELWFDDDRADSPDTVAILLDLLRGA
jgi:hypothetical protein